MINTQPSQRTEPLGVHLSEEKLFQLLTGQVTPDEKQQLEAHLQQCALCTDALEGFARADSAATQATLLELNHLIKKRTTRRKTRTLLTDIKAWGVATAIVFLILISAAIVWNAVHSANTSSVTKPKASAQNLYARPVKGYSHLRKYLNLRANLPAGASRKGKVRLRFTVNPDSSLSNFTVVAGLEKATNLAAIELVKQGPTWQPANRQGQNKAQTVSVTILFK
ncbi:energy transducer TonB [Adhaeribacter radiodurans]|uniref:Energy transducer TonB n=1 Tax=Adhaeribacter radiodurans TaxID=2745197 RepID=A0A7L7L8W9_9BACT|nr:energy transducer TonB [Adhaeribacter radiodurans]QMU29276.1 energy transducer TonB [Adhaeribacter radiodurans]